MTTSSSQGSSVDRLCSTAALLDRCRDAGIKLTADGQNLGFRAPPGALTPELRAAIVARKGEVLALLGGAGGSVVRCPDCRRPLDEKARCWHCDYRACEKCGKPTGTALQAHCLTCDCGGR
jgi:hypothetical protein